MFHSKFLLVILLCPIFLLTSCDGEKKTVDGLVKQLGARKYSERKKATEELIKTGTKALDILIKNENNNDPEIRNRVRSIIDKIMRNALKSKNSSDIKRVKSLCQSDKKSYIRYLRAIVNDKNERGGIRANALKLLIECDKKSTLKWILDVMFKDYESYGFLGTLFFRDDVVVEDLLKLLNDKKLNLTRRSEIANILGLHGTQKAINGLLESLLRVDQDIFGKAYILRSLKPLIGQLKNEKDPKKIKDAQKKLEQIKAALKSFIESKADADLKKMATDLLGKIG